MSQCCDQVTSKNLTFTQNKSKANGMILLIIDTETTGLLEVDSVCEIAATLYQIGESKRTERSHQFLH